MTFHIDTGFEPPIAKSASVDDTQTIRFSDWYRADRTKRQIIETIESLDDPVEVFNYVEAETLIIDALHLSNWPDMADEIDTVAKEHRSALIDGGAGPCPAEPDITTAQQPELATAATKGKTMTFAFDQGASGSEGPWVQWSARGTQDGSVPARSFYLREEGGTKTPIDSFSKGVVLDIVNMKTGWQRSDGIQGQAPDWKWNADIGHMQPQPGDDYKKGLQVKCALGGGKAATWEQAGAAVWNAFVGIVPALQQGPGDGSLPLVRLVSVKEERFARGSTATPVLEVVKWVPRPDCLKEGATIAMEPAPVPAPAVQPAAQPEPAAADADLDF